MSRIERDLETVKQTRALHRASRRRVPYPIIALIGYTNAGKSTIFNRLTAADVLAEDLLFATLDPTARAIRLPHGATAILSDTVGFISDLPTTLVAAFRATLEDVVEADVLLHVRDISHVESAAEAADVEEVLRQLGIDPTDRSRLVEVWNKADLLHEGELQRLAAIAARAAPDERPSLVSAKTGEGADALLQAIEERVSRGRPVFRVIVPAADGQALHWLYEEAEVIERDTEDNGDVSVVARVAADKMNRLCRRFPSAERLS
jgi:GTP-binding protein HflX